MIIYGDNNSVRELLLKIDPTFNAKLKNCDHCSYYEPGQYSVSFKLENKEIKIDNINIEPYEEKGKPGAITNYLY